MRKLKSVFCLLMFCIAAGMQAQLPTATLFRNCEDSQGALIQGARVILTSTTQGTTRESSHQR